MGAPLALQSVVRGGAPTSLPSRLPSGVWVILHTHTHEPKDVFFKWPKCAPICVVRTVFAIQYNLPILSANADSPTLHRTKCSSALASRTLGIKSLLNLTSSQTYSKSLSVPSACALALEDYPGCGMVHEVYRCPLFCARDLCLT